MEDEYRKNQLKKTTISSLNSFDKKELPVHIPATKKLDAKAKNIDIVMIGADTYCAAFFLKRTQVFSVLMQDI